MTTRIGARSLALVAAAAMAVALGSASAAQAAPPSHSADPAAGRYIVTFSPGADCAAQVAKARGKGAKVTREYRAALKGMAAELTPAQVAELRADPAVASVIPDGVVSVADIQTPVTWGLDRLDQRSLPLTNSYSYSTSASNVTAYVIDTGVRADHAQFAGRVAPGFDAVQDGNGTNDCNGHGTHVAGTIGGSTYGVAKGVTIVPVRVLDCSGSGYWSWVIAGIDWVAANAQKPAVANMSLGGGSYSTLDSAVANAVAKGVTFAVAAGNSNADACYYSPARTPSAITVGATTSTDSRSSFSNYGTCVDIFAPGSSITSAWNSSATATNTISGTSMATPHVAGAAALYLSGHPTASPAEVATALTSAATTTVVASAGTGSPNRLLYVDGLATPPPPPAAPAITSFSPSSGPVGTSVTITGSDLSGASVQFNGTSATVTSTSATSISVTVPSGATTGTIRVTTPGGTASSATAFTVTLALPTAPRSLSVTSITRTTATARWVAPTTGAPLLRYEVRVSKSGSGIWSAWTSVGTATSAGLSGLTANTKYAWQVRAVNATGTGASAQGSFTTSR